jgi:hypothetical protein
MKKTIYTLSVNNYEPEITSMTFPFMQRYAKKIGADFVVIKDRKFPDYPIPFEKFQIYDLSKERGDDWSIFFDADTLIHPDFWDITTSVHKDTTISGMTSDFTPIRFRPDAIFQRDGRWIGKGNWFMVASDWCRDVWAPLDITKEEAISNITVTMEEAKTGMKSDHLLDDYAVSRNIARFGLKHVLLSQIQNSMGLQGGAFLLHWYIAPPGWCNPVVDPKTGFTQAELNQIQSHYGKPILELTIPEIKMCLISKNAGLWQVPA